MNTPIITLDPLTLPGDITLQFAMTINRDSRLKSIDKFVYIKEYEEEAEEEIELIASQYIEIRPKDPYFVYVDVGYSDKSNLEFTWSFDPALPDDYFENGLDYHILKGLPEKLTEGEEYTFTLTAAAIDSTVAYSESVQITVYVQKAPRITEFVSSQYVGTANSDEFTLECKAITDDSSDTSIEYSFSYRVDGNEKLHPIALNVGTERVTTKLKEGSLEVFCKACSSRICGEKKSITITSNENIEPAADQLTQLEAETDYADPDSVIGSVGLKIDVYTKLVDNSAKQDFNQEVADGRLFEIKD